MKNNLRRRATGHINKEKPQEKIYEYESRSPQNISRAMSTASIT